MFSDAPRPQKKTGKALLFIYICVQGILILILRVDFSFKKIASRSFDDTEV